METRSQRARLARWNPPNRLKQPIRSLLAALGFEIVRLRRPQTLFLQDLLRRQRISLMVDVGANQGQYAMRMRALGYRGRILSFEPSREAFRLLAHHASTDPRWDVQPCALGAAEGVATLNVSRDSVSSSLLEVAEALLLAAPASAVHHMETVPLRRLDDAVNCQTTDNVWLKLDIQGSEDQALAGAAGLLARTRVVQVEVSLLPCYKRQADYVGLFEVLHRSGLRLAYVEPGTQRADTGEMLQFDGIFSRVPASRSCSSQY